MASVRERNHSSLRSDTHDPRSYAHTMPVTIRENPLTTVAIPRLLRRNRRTTGASFSAFRIDSATPIARPRSACKPTPATDPGPVAYATAKRRAGTLTIVCGNLLHHLDLQVALGNQRLQPRVLGLECLGKRHPPGNAWGGWNKKGTNATLGLFG